MKASKRGWRRNRSFLAAIKVENISISESSFRPGLNKKKSKNVSPWTCKSRGLIKHWSNKLLRASCQENILRNFEMQSWYLWCSLSVPSQMWATPFLDLIIQKIQNEDDLFLLIDESVDWDGAYSMPSWSDLACRLTYPCTEILQPWIICPL